MSQQKKDGVNLLTMGEAAIMIMKYPKMRIIITREVRRPMKLHYCCRNLKKGARPLYKHLKEAFPEVKHKKKDCLGRCGKCSKQMMVRVGKTGFFCSSSADDIYSEIKKMLG
ncbi:DUF1450 domain-containing protein [Paenibacillus turpanensis]|uniref:DUF1450 domain-containing protein n=1 Tax=Paenibacillus turpanensis TaxID=2689078 RepID=UPI00140DC9EC|nr:DUF1450 domain-containing protein [Paenibacillus turpanensis]